MASLSSATATATTIATTTIIANYTAPLPPLPLI